MPATASVRTLRNDYARLIAAVEAGETITILRHGKAVAQLSPMPAANTSLNWRESAAFKRKGVAIPEAEVRAVLDYNKGQF